MGNLMTIVVKLNLVQLLKKKEQDANTSEVN